MTRQSSCLAVLSLLVCSPLVGLAGLSCSGGESTAETPDGSAASDGSASPDASLVPDAGPPVDAPETEAGTDARVTDAADAGDAPDGGNGCAAVTSAPVQVHGQITQSTTWTCDHTYLVSGVVEVVSPGDAGTTVLTIEPGTTILMSNDTDNDGNLLIGPGAQLSAVGTADLPIVFTSSAVGVGASPAPGDWGCVALTGLAPGNWGTAADGGAQMSGTPDDANGFPPSFPFPFTAGSDDPSHDTDSSGTLKYVRLEYGGAVRINVGDAGVEEADHEMLGMYGVGSGTVLEYLDMRQSRFGCLFAEGGQFLARHLICQYGGESGGFDFSRGNQSRAQFLLAQEDPNHSSEGLGYKGPGDVNQLAPLTSPAVYNVTACGTFGGIDQKDPYSFFLRRAPGGVLANFVGTGYRGGLQMNGGAGSLPDGGNAVATTRMQSSILFGNFDPTTPDAGTNVFDPAPAGNADTDMVAWFENPAWKNATTDPGISHCASANTLQVAPATANTTNAATPPSDGFFDTSATYIGAFKDTTDTWATGKWVVWSDH
jgi:hypothetical protein